MSVVSIEVPDAIINLLGSVEEKTNVSIDESASFLVEAGMCMLLGLELEMMEESKKNILEAMENNPSMKDVSVFLSKTYLGES